jgi:hypothetical protein
MSLSNLLNRLESLAFRRRRAFEVTRVGDVVIASGVANDVAAPANDSFRPHIVARRVERRERRDIRSA